MTKNASRSNSVDLFAIAQQTMVEAGFVPDFPGAVNKEIQSIIAKTPPSPSATSERDLRTLLWSAIDDSKSRDLDQVEYAEALDGGATRILVGIADVDAFVSKGSAIDQHAAENATSVYAGVRTFPMLPEELSTDLTSLVAGQDRLAVVIEMVVTHDGTVKNTVVYRALLQNHARLSYEAVGDWLDGKTGVPPGVKAVPGLEAQIRLQSQTANRFGEFRKEHGALELGTIQATPVETFAEFQSALIAKVCDDYRHVPWFVTLFPKFGVSAIGSSVYEFIVKVGIIPDEAIPQDFFGNINTVPLNKLFPGRGISIANNEPFDEIVEFLLRVRDSNRTRVVM